MLLCKPISCLEFYFFLKIVARVTKFGENFGSNPDLRKQHLPAFITQTIQPVKMYILSCVIMSFALTVGLFAAFPVSHSSFSVITIDLWRGFVSQVTWDVRDDIWWGLQPNGFTAAALQLGYCGFVERSAPAEHTWWHRVKYHSTLGHCFHLYRRQQKCVQPHQ